jgi:hypothetical protein
MLVIKKFILPGTNICSDYWKAYDEIPNAGIDYFKVNHSKNYVSPDTRAHTNTIEAKWNNLKKKDAPPRIPGRPGFAGVPRQADVAVHSLLPPITP